MNINMLSFLKQISDIKLPVADLFQEINNIFNRFGYLLILLGIIYGIQNYFVKINNEYITIISYLLMTLLVGFFSYCFFKSSSIISVYFKNKKELSFFKFLSSILVTLIFHYIFIDNKKNVIAYSILVKTFKKYTLKELYGQFKDTNDPLIRAAITCVLYETENSLSYKEILLVEKMNENGFLEFKRFNNTGVNIQYDFINNLVKLKEERFHK